MGEIMDKYNNFYFHSVRFSFDVLENILKCGYILSREKAKSNRNYVSFNGNKWISICKYYNNPYFSDYDQYSAYQTLIINDISIVLDDKIEAIKTLYMPYDCLYEGVISEDNLIRYSDLIDEFQVRDSISRDHFLALMYPFMKSYDVNKEVAQGDYWKIRGMLEKYNYNIPIIDSSDEVIEKSLDDLEKRLIK